MSSATASTTPEDEVDTLMQQVADTHNLDFKSRAADASTAPVQQQQQADSSEAEETLESRLAALRG